MSIDIKGKKLNMSQIFLETGRVIPVTLLKIESELSNDLNGKDVVVVGTSKGKGFTGVMKRWGFHGQQATRGQSDRPRAPGSIGAQTPGRVFPGKKMAGKSGCDRVTVKGLKIVGVDLEKKEVMVSGPVPGARNSKIKVKVL